MKVTYQQPPRPSGIYTVELSHEERLLLQDALYLASMVIDRGEAKSFVGSLIGKGDWDAVRRQNRALYDSFGPAAAEAEHAD